MANKRNEATLNRPGGNRIIDAPYVFADIQEYARQLKKERAWKKNDRNGITIFKTDRLTMVLTSLHKGSVVKDNAVNGIISLQVLKGKVWLRSPDSDIELRQDQLMNFHPYIRYSIRALKDSILLLTNFVCVNRIVGGASAKQRLRL
jgi:quercetin dioxygenase-like cupin family protein